jgi:hypothetical protein
LARAQAKLQDIASRRLYLTPEEQRTIVPSNRVNVERTNALDDLPLSRPVIVAGNTVQGIVPGTTLQTGFTTPDGRTVFKDRRTEKIYVLQSPRDRVAELTATSVNRLNANIQEFNATIGTINTAIATAAEVQATLNNKVLKAEFGVNLVQQAQTVNDITQQARININTTNEENTDQQNSDAQANANIVFESDTFSIDAQTKTITTTTRRLSASQAVNQATGYNRRIAENNGYTTPLTIRPSGPKNINVNGQSVYELTLSIGYRDFNPLNNARFEQLGQVQSVTTVGPISLQTNPTIIAQIPNALPLPNITSTIPTQVANTTQFVRTSATTTTSPTTPRPSRTNEPPPQIVPGGDIVALPKLSVFEINALNNRLASPFISDEEKDRIRQILGVSQQIPPDLQLPEDPKLEFSQEVTRPNLNVSVSGNIAKLSFNAGRAVNVEYSIDNGRTWTILNPPSRAGDITIDNLSNGVYAARVRGIRADGTKTEPSQPKALVIQTSQPRILRIDPESSTSGLIIFDDAINPATISKYQFTTRSDNSLWIDALSATNEKRVVRSPIIAYALEENKTYTIRIRAVYLDGTPGNPSNSVNFTTFKTQREGGGLIA